MKGNMIAYVASSILLAGFFYMTYKNSPKHAWLLLAIVTVAVIIGFIKPLEKYILIDVALAIIGVFIVMIQSRNVREKNVQKWFAAKGFRKADLPLVKDLFNEPGFGTNSYYAYRNELTYQQKTVHYILAVSCHSHFSGKTPTIVFHCAYYFKEQIGAAILEQKFKDAKEATPHTNMFKSQLRYFDLKDCDIFRPATGGIVVRWKVPHSVNGYNERFEWIMKTVSN